MQIGGEKKKDSGKLYSRDERERRREGEDEVVVIK